MLNFEPNYWYVYILHNNNAKSFYIGLHHQIGNKPYSHSSNSVSLKQAIEDGNVDEYIVYKGDSKEKAHALETYLINLAKDNGVEVYNKNSGGGHRGGARQNILEEKDYIVGENMLIHNIFPETFSVDKYIEENARIEKLADEVAEAVFVQRNTPDKVIHKVTYEPVDYIEKLSFLQITENHVDPREVDRVAESMMRDIKAAESLVEACTIVEMPDGSEKRIDGTTTCYAIIKTNIWPTIPVVRFKSSVFNDSESLMRNYASARNVPKKYKKAQEPKKELKKHIHAFHMEHQELFENSYEDFCECFKASYNRRFSSNSISKNLKSYRDKYYEDILKGDNWINYKANDSKLLKKISSQVLRKFPKSITSKVSYSNLEREGVANPANFFGNGNSRGKDTEVILAHHTTPETEDDEIEIFERLKRSFAFCNFYPDHSKSLHGFVPFVGKHNGIKIYVVSLPARYDTQRKGDMAVNIINSIFDEQKIAA